MIGKCSKNIQPALPITWDIDSVQACEWRANPFINKAGVQKAFDVGYVEDHFRLYRTPFGDVSQPAYSHLYDTLKGFPNFERAMVWFQKQKPGGAIPTHFDPCLPNMYNHYWGDNHGIPSENFRRAIVYLEDHKDGHLNVVDGIMHYSWKAGEYLYWDNTILHSAANMGIEDKLVLVIDYYI